MLKNIDKIYTFLVVYETKSFSKAAETLNISQPAITQKIKQLENFLDTSLIERKKNGIILTKKGKYFLEIAKNLKECMDSIELKINNFKKESIPVTIGATSTISNYILPKFLPNLRELLKKNINIITKDNSTLIRELENKKFDLIFTTIESNSDDIEFVPLFKDEIVFFSNKPLPKKMDFDELKNYDFICRENESVIRREVSKTLKKHGFSCEILNIKSFVDNSTTLKFTILNANKQFVSMASYFSIEDEVKQNRLFTTKIKNIDLHRTIYIAYLKSNNSASVKSIINYLTNIN
jgi:DNA-binding transcriptional LysR family regulator